MVVEGDGAHRAFAGARRRRVSRGRACREHWFSGSDRQADWCVTSSSTCTACTR